MRYVTSTSIFLTIVTLTGCGKGSDRELDQELSPSAVTIDFEEASRLMDQQWYVEAIGAIERKSKDAKTAADRSWVFVMIGNCYVGLKNYELALTNFEKSIDEHEKNFMAYEGIGIIHSRRAEFANAKEMYETAHKLKPDYASVFYRLAEDALVLGEYQKAIEHLEQCIKLDGTERLAYIEMAAAFTLMGRIDEAKLALDKVQIPEIDAEEILDCRLEEIRAKNIKLNNKSSPDRDG